jgi:hypothetical protein
MMQYLQLSDPALAPLADCFNEPETWTDFNDFLATITGISHASSDVDDDSECEIPDKFAKKLSESVHVSGSVKQLASSAVAGSF